MSVPNVYVIGAANVGKSAFVRAAPDASAWRAATAPWASMPAGPTPRAA